MCVESHRGCPAAWMGGGTRQLALPWAAGQTCCPRGCGQARAPPPASPSYAGSLSQQIGKTDTGADSIAASRAGRDSVYPAATLAAREQRSACSAQAAAWTERREGRLPEDQHPGASRTAVPGGAGADAGHSKHGWAWGPSTTAQRGRPWAPDTPGARPVGSRRGDPKESLPDTHTHLESPRSFSCGIWGGG